jgi:hypothetical protein
MPRSPSCHFFTCAVNRTPPAPPPCHDLVLHIDVFPAAHGCDGARRRATLGPSGAAGSVLDTIQRATRFIFRRPRWCGSALIADSSGGTEPATRVRLLLCFVSRSGAAALKRDGLFMWAQLCSSFVGTSGKFPLQSWPAVSATLRKDRRSAPFLPCRHCALAPTRDDHHTLDALLYRRWSDAI